MTRSRSGRRGRPKSWRTLPSSCGFSSTGGTSSRWRGYARTSWLWAGPHVSTADSRHATSRLGHDRLRRTSKDQGPRHPGRRTPARTGSPQGRIPVPLRRCPPASPRRRPELGQDPSRNLHNRGSRTGLSAAPRIGFLPSLNRTARRGPVLPGLRAGDLPTDERPGRGRVQGQLLLAAPSTPRGRWWTSRGSAGGPGPLFLPVLHVRRTTACVLAAAGTARCGEATLLGRGTRCWCRLRTTTDAGGLLASRHRPTQGVAGGPSLIAS